MHPGELHPMTRARIVAALLLLPALAMADAKKDAREAYDRGTAAYKRGDFAGAARGFADADRLAPSSVALGAALDAAVKADDPILGIELLERAKRAPDDAALSEKTALARAKLGGRAGRLVIDCTACTALLDGQEAGPRKDLWVKAGPHTVLLRSEGKEHTVAVDVRADATTEAKIPEGGSGVATAAGAATAPASATATATATAPATAPAPASAPAPATAPATAPASSSASGLPPWVFFSGLGLTVGAGVATLATGATTASQHDAFVRLGCGGAAPPADCAKRASDGKTLQTVTNVLAVTTGVLAATTVVLAIVTQWKRAPWRPRSGRRAAGSRCADRSDTLPRVSQAPHAGGPQSSRYEALLKLASGGMATVWIGAARGGLGFRQLVAIKRPHPHLLERPDYRREIIAEARLASLIHHANVVDVRDVEVEGEQISLVMDYVEGASLGELLVAASKRGERVPPKVVVRIVLDALAGLHAAHEAKDERGRAIGLIHRDISPQNLLVGVDGVGRVADFGVAKLTDLSTTHGTLKGKLGYMPPEYLRGEKIDRRFDVFAMGVILWESSCGKRLFKGEHDADTFNRILSATVPRVSEVVPELGGALDSIVEVALAKSRDERFDNALAMASALETCAREVGLVARHADVAQTVESLAGPVLAARRDEIRKKLAQEPSILSLMSADRVDIPDGPPTRPEREVPEETRSNRDVAAATAPPAPTSAPSHGMPATTLPLAQQTPAPPPAYTSFEATEEPSRGYEPMEVSTIPTRSGLRTLFVALALAAFVGIGITAWMLRGRGAAEAPPSPAPSAPLPLVATGAPASSTTSLAPLVPSASASAVAHPTQAPAHHPTHSGSPSATTPRGPATPASATGGPPPNPYTE